MTKKTSVLPLTARYCIARALIAAGIVSTISTSAWATCGYTVTNNWGAGFTAEITVTNDTTQTVSTWAVAWKEPSATLTNFWNGTITGSNPYTATPASWNGSLAPKASATFGFQATGTAAAPLVSGSLCGANTASSSSSSSPSSVASSSIKSSTSVSSSTTSSAKSSSSLSSSVSSSSSTKTSSSSSTASSSSAAVMLSQTGNPIYSALGNYKTWLSSASDAAAKLAADKIIANNMITWQMPHGGFYKNALSVYSNPWDGIAERSGWSGDNGVELGTIDNNATVSELLFLADVYQRSGDSKYRDSARKALEFLFTMQYSSGGWPQVYPKRAGVIYSNYVTFNDDAMARVLILLDQIQKQEAPLNGDIFTSDQRTKAATAINNGVGYILKAQIVQNKVKTVWCAQHDPVTYEPRGARSYELESKSGKESVLVAAFLMSRPQTAEIAASVKAAIAWYKSSAVKVLDTAYVRRAATSTDDSYNPIVSKVGSTMWYRFYDLNADTGFFSGRLSTDTPPGVGKQYNLMAVEPERRYGYEWGGSYGTKLITYSDSVGYF